MPIANMVSMNPATAYLVPDGSRRVAVIHSAIVPNCPKRAKPTEPWLSGTTKMINGSNSTIHTRPPMADAMLSPFGPYT